MKDFAILTAVLLAIVSACTIVEVLDIAEPEPVPMPMMQIKKDTTKRDTIKQDDTIRIPIGFGVAVDEWDSTIINLEDEQN